MAPEAAPPGIRGELENADRPTFGFLTAPIPAPTIADPRDPKSYGAMAFSPVATTMKTPLTAKLTKVASAIRSREAMLAPGGALNSGSLAGKPIDELGAVVTGVNDQGAVAEDFAAPTGFVASAPMSAASLADQRAREAKYGDGASAPTDMRVATADVSPPPNGKRPKAFDASEGTPLDPLLNRTYDLTSPKTIPVIR